MSKLDAKTIIALAREEMLNGNIQGELMERCHNLTPEMSLVLASGVLAKALAFGYSIDSVIEEYVKEWNTQDAES